MRTDSHILYFACSVLAEAGYYIIVVNPSNFNQLFILGIGVEACQADLETLTERDNYILFRIKTQDVETTDKGIPIFIDHFAKPLPMEVRKKLINEEEEGGAPCSHASLIQNSSCELIVTGYKEGTSRPCYYAVTAAHCFFPPQKPCVCWRLMDGCYAPATNVHNPHPNVKEIENVVNRHSSRYEWFLAVYNDSTIMKAEAQPLFLYQQFFERRHGRQNNFMLDIALVPINAKVLIEKGWIAKDGAAPMRQQNIHTLSLPKCLRCHDDVHYNIVGYYNVAQGSHIFNLVGVQVVVRSTLGCIEPQAGYDPRIGAFADRPTESIDFGQHILFYTESRFVKLHIALIFNITRLHHFKLSKFFK